METFYSYGKQLYQMLVIASKLDRQFSTLPLTGPLQALILGLIDIHKLTLDALSCFNNQDITFWKPDLHAQDYDFF